MKPAVSLAAIALSVSLLGACASRQAYAPDEHGVVELRIRAGDEIRVVTRDRARFSFEVTEVHSDRLVGVTVKPAPHETLPKGQPVEVPYTDLALLETRHFSSLRTAGAVAVITIVGALVTQPIAVMPSTVP